MSKSNSKDKFNGKLRTLVYNKLKKLISINVYSDGIITDTPKVVAGLILSNISPEELDSLGSHNIGKKAIELELINIMKTTKTIRFAPGVVDTHSVRRGKGLDGSAAESVLSKKRQQQIESKVAETRFKKQLVGTVVLRNGLCVLRLDDPELDDVNIVLLQNDSTRACVNKRVGVSLLPDNSSKSTHGTYQVDLCFDSLKDLTPLERRDVELLYKYNRPMFYLLKTKYSERTNTPYPLPLNQQDADLKARCDEQIYRLMAMFGGAKKPGEFSEFTPEIIDRISKQSGLTLRDERNIPYTSWDPPKAGDYDDAIFSQKTKDGYIAKVAIAACGLLVSKGDPLLEYWLYKFMSDYPAPIVNAMNPPEISEDLCSLVQGKTRLALVGQFHLDNNGDILSYDFYPASIVNHCQTDYPFVDRVHDGDSTARGSLSKELLDTMVI